MADAKTPKHLTSIDFDISAIATQLQNVQEQLAETAKNIASGEQYKIKLNLDTTQTGGETEKVRAEFQRTIRELNGQKINLDFGGTYSDVEKAKVAITQMVEKYGELAKIQIRTNEQGITKAAITFDDEQGRKIIANYELQKEELGQLTGKVGEYQARWKLTNTQLVDDMKTRSAQEQRAAAEAEKAYKKELDNLDKIIQKNKELIASIKSTPTNSTMQKTLSEATVNLEKLQEVRAKVASTKMFSDGDKANITEYDNNVKNLTNTLKNANQGTQNFIKTITDKARWLAAFYLVNQLRQAFVGSIAVIKDTEEAVIELQRVLNEDISQSAMSKELYEIAETYGRSFAEVSETAVKFAQTGAKWNDALELTRSTMLAVNTAELDVNTATTGLIAVMSQFNIEAADMEALIDKINITADNFAVTSEKIVAALQRAGGSAVNAKLSLEETIAAITTLSEATGRSGQNIGTALNSLLIYTAKPKALDVFADLSDGMAQLVKDYRKGAASIIDIWLGLSDTIGELSTESQLALEKSLSTDEDFAKFTEAFEAEATEAESTIKSIYSTAGTFRQNYLISWLSNAETYSDVLDKLTEAEGYSLAENEKAMSTLTRQWESLKVAVQELAVAWGEAGALDALKSIVKFAKGLADVQKSIGGIGTALGYAFAIMLRIKAQRLADGISKLAQTSVLFKKALEGTAITAKSLQTAFGWISVAAAAITTLYAAIKGVQTANEESRQAAIENANNSMEQAQSTKQLVIEYKNLVNMTDDTAEKTQALAEYKKKLIEVYGYEVDAVEKLNGARADEIAFLDEEYATNVKLAYAQISEQYETARKNMEEAPSKFWTAFDIPEKSINILRKYADITGEIGQVKWFDLGTGDLVEQQKILAEMVNEENIDIETKKILKKQLDSVTAAIDKNNEAYQTGIKTIAEYTVLTKYNEDIIGVGSIEAYEALTEKIKENTENAKVQAGMLSFLASMFPEYSTAVADAAIAESDAANNANALFYSLETLQELASDLNSEIDNTQSSFKTLSDVVTQYNSTGVMTVDMLQQIMSLSGEYAALLDFTSEGISINQEATERLAGSKQELIRQMLATQAAAQIEGLAQSLLAEQNGEAERADYAAKVANESLATSLYNIIPAASSAASAMQSFWQSTVNNYGLKGNYAKRFEQGAKQILKNTQEMYKNLGSVMSGGGGGGGGGSSSDSSLKKQLEAQKKAIKERYQAEIDALKKVEKENDRIRKKEEYERRQSENVRDLAQAQARSGIENREKEFEIQEKINEEDKKWQQQLEDWSIEDKIKELEALRDAEIAVIDEQLQALQSVASAGAGAIGGSVAAFGDNLFSSVSKGIIDATEQIEEMGNKAMDATADTAEMAKTSAEKIIQENADILDEESKFALQHAQQVAEFLNQIYDETLVQPTRKEFYNIFGNPMLDIAKANAIYLYDIYSKNFTSPLKAEIQGIFSSSVNALNRLKQNIAIATYGGGVPVTQSTTNNYRGFNTNVVANVSSTSGAAEFQRAMNGIINRSKLP